MDMPVLIIFKTSNIVNIYFKLGIYQCIEIGLKLL